MSRETGKFAEIIATNYLKHLGYNILEENYNCPLIGEIDIIAKDEFVLVFVEVKYASTYNYSIFEKITPKKKRRLINSANLYIQRYKIDLFCRFDAIFVIKDEEYFKIEHFENVIT